MKLYETFGKTTLSIRNARRQKEPTLGSDCRPRRKASTKALKCLKDTLDDDDLYEKDSLPVGSL